MKFIRATFLVSVGLSSTVGFAGQLTTGIVFSNVGDSIAVNPAALAGEKSGAARLTYVPVGSVPSGGYALSVASSGDKAGFGASLSAMNAGSLVLGNAVVGAGFKLSPGLALGASASFSVNNPAAMDFSAGLAIGKSRGFRAAALVSSVQALGSSGAISAGVGYAQSNYQLELNVAHPLAAALPNSVSAAAAMYFGVLGLGVNGGFTTGSSTDFSPASYSYGASALLNLGKNFGVDAHYEISSNALSFGLTYGF